MRRFLSLAILSLTLSVAASFALPVPQDDESPPQERHRADGKSCDNSFERKPEDRCACEHAQNCNPNDPADKEKHSHMTALCQWYCHEDMCKCGNSCNS